MSALLRIALPNLAQVDVDAFDYAWLDRRGAVQETGRARLQALAERAKGKPLELLLHPDDSLLASLTLPPLPVARLADAVALGADTLLLAERDTLQLVHGPRDAGSGRVQLAWLEREALERLLQEFARHGLKPRALYPAPFFLPVQQAGCTATLMGGQLVVREGLQEGWLHPLPEQAREALDQRGDVVWLDEDERWQGPAPACNLLRGWHLQQKPARWGRALACCLLAILVWAGGLQWQAAQLAGEGQALQRQMVEQVREAFPHISVVLNPLQQARQERERGQGGADTFAGLLQQAGNHMPFLAGNLQALEYDGTTLSLLRRSPVVASSDPAWREALAKAGLEVQDRDDGWSLRGASQGTSDEP